MAHGERYQKKNSINKPQTKSYSPFFSQDTRRRNKYKICFVLAYFIHSSTVYVTFWQHFIQHIHPYKAFGNGTLWCSVDDGLYGLRPVQFIFQNFNFSLGIKLKTCRILIPQLIRRTNTRLSLCVPSFRIFCIYSSCKYMLTWILKKSDLSWQKRIIRLKYYLLALKHTHQRKTKSRIVRKYSGCLSVMVWFGYAYIPVRNEVRVYL